MLGVLNLKPGDHLQDYTLTEYINHGATADIWRVRDSTGLDKALKIYAPSKNSGEITLDVLLEEFKLTIPFEHPNILKAEKIGAYKGVPFLVMPYCTGSLADIINLRQAQRKQQKESNQLLFSVPECATLLKQIGEALQYLHALDICHRDIKPENILVYPDSDGEHYVLSDFGISSANHTKRLKSPLDGVQLTPAYASPEQMKGRAQNSSDIFSLCVIVYEMLEGSLPTEGQMPIGEWLNEGKPMKEIKVSMPVALKRLLIQGLHAIPEGRPEAKDVVNVAEDILATPQNIPEVETETVSYLESQEEIRRTQIFRPKEEVPEEVYRQLEENQPALTRPNYVSDQKFSSNPNPPSWTPVKSRSGKMWYWMAGAAAVLLLAGWMYSTTSGHRSAVTHQEALRSFHMGDIQHAINLWESIDYKPLDGINYLHATKELLKELKGRKIDGIRKFEFGRAAIKEKGKEAWGFIDTSGKIIIPMQYAEVVDFDSPFELTAACKINGVPCGFVDLNGREQDFIFNKCKRIEGNQWEVVRQGGYANVTEKISPIPMNR